MKLQHLIITRSNIYWQEEALSEEWNKSRLELFNSNLRASLAAQSVQNFKLISLWGKIYNGGELENEYKELINLVPLKNNRTEEEKRLWGREYYNQVKKTAQKHSSAEFTLITRVDTDDLLEYCFVENLQNAIKFNIVPYYYDVERILLIRNGKVVGEKTDHKVRGNTSSFISVLEREIECYPYKLAHPDIGKVIKGEIVPTLTGTCFLHDLNISRKFAKRAKTR